MRYDSIERLRSWANYGTFPAIHDDIVSVISSYMTGGTVLDLCCSYGLLAQRVGEMDPTLTAYGIDADKRVLDQARKAGIGVGLFQMKIGTDTLSELVQFVGDRKVDCMFARRALPELFGTDLPLGRAFAVAIRDAGVRELFIEGRVATPGATNALRSINEEVDLMTGPFAQARRVGSVSYMRASETN